MEVCAIPEVREGEVLHGEDIGSQHVCRDAKCCRGAPYFWDKQYLQVPVKTMAVHARRMCNLHRYSVHRIEQ